MFERSVATSSKFLSNLCLFFLSFCFFPSVLIFYSFFIPTPSFSPLPPLSHFPSLSFYFVLFVLPFPLLRFSIWLCFTFAPVRRIIMLRTFSYVFGHLDLCLCDMPVKHFVTSFLGCAFSYYFLWVLYTFYTQHRTALLSHAVACLYSVSVVLFTDQYLSLMLSKHQSSLIRAFYVLLKKYLCISTS